MKFKDLKVGDVLYNSGFLSGCRSFYLVTKVYKNRNIAQNIKNTFQNCFDCYNFQNGKLELGRTYIKGFSKSKISHLFK